MYSYVFLIFITPIIYDKGAYGRGAEMRDDDVIHLSRGVEHVMRDDK